MNRQENALRVVLAPIQGVEVRDSNQTGDGSWTIEGYAAVYEQATTLWDGRWFQMDEEIARGAFTNVLTRVTSGDETVHLNYVHEMASAVAATDVRNPAGSTTVSEAPVGGLTLREDAHGLRFFARVDPEDPDAQRMAVKMRRGVVKQASFAFTIASEELAASGETEDGRDYEKWRVTEIGHLFDVCACPQGAYSQTEVGIRSLAAASFGLADVTAGRQRLATAGADSISINVDGEELFRAVTSGGDDDQAREHLLWQAQMRAQIRRTKGGIQ
jgi:HK97 family phage prohead protease